MKATQSLTWKTAGALGLVTLALPVLAQQNTNTNTTLVNTNATVVNTNATLADTNTTLADTNAALANTNANPTAVPDPNPPAAAVANPIPAVPNANPTTATAPAAGGSLGQIEGGGQLLGKPVYSSDNRSVGTLRDLVVDVESGRVLYGVVSTGGGNVAVAPQEFGAFANGRIPLKVTAQKIQGAPKFTSAMNQPGQIARADFIYQVYQYFGQPAWWQGSTPANQGSFHNVHKESNIIGMNVKSAENQPLGRIASMQVDMSNGHVLYLIMTPDPSLGLPNHYYVLPPQAFTLSPDQKNLVSGIDKQKLASAPNVDRNTWSKLSDPTFASQVYQYYGKEPYFGGALQPTGR